MPSPFPGMDPYLENPRWFHGLHNNLITYFEEQLQPRLPSPYYAKVSIVTEPSSAKSSRLRCT